MEGNTSVFTRTGRMLSTRALTRPDHMVRVDVATDNAAELDSSWQTVEGTR